MIKLLFTGLLFLNLNANVGSRDVDIVNTEETTVYICHSTTAKKYHYSKTCRGLSACTHEIKKVSLEDAKDKYSRTLCGWED